MVMAITDTTRKVGLCSTCATVGSAKPFAERVRRQVQGCHTHRNSQEGFLALGLGVLGKPENGQLLASRRWQSIVPAEVRLLNFACAQSCLHRGANKKPPLASRQMHCQQQIQPALASPLRQLQLRWPPPPFPQFVWANHAEKPSSALPGSDI